MSATRSTNLITTAATSSNPTHPTQRIVEYFLLIWLDANLDESKEDCQPALTQVRAIVNHIKIFNQTDPCFEYLKQIEKEKVFIIASGALGQHLVPQIHTLPQIDAIYIACGNKSRHEQWTKDWMKVKGLHTNIKPICEALEVTVKQCNQNSVVVSVVTVDDIDSNTNLNQLDPAYMYNQILKEILSDMETDDGQEIRNLTTYCRKYYTKNNKELSIIDEFEQSYRSKSSIWWYTRECFVYQMLSRALRYLEVDTVINMGYFMHDLDKQIEQLHRKQITTYRGKSFVVCRGQVLLKTDYDKLRKAKDGLLSFNNFLFARKNREVAFELAMSASGKDHTVGILFKITIDPSVPSAPFASVREVHYSKTAEEEILFSLHTVFRIGEITKIDDNNSIYEVSLKLTADADKQLCTVTKRIRNEAGSGTGWRRLGNLLLKIRQLEKAEEVYNILLEQTSDESEKAAYYNQLGYIRSNQDDYEKAIDYYEKALAIKEKTLPPDDPSLATSYNNIGAVYNKMEDYSNALLYYEKGLQMKQKTLPPIHPSLATSYNNIAEVCRNMKEYSKALSFYEKLLEIQLKTLASNHPSLATSYSKIGDMCRSIDQNTKAFSNYEKALVIRERTLPPDHPDMATSYNNLGEVCRNMRQHSKALTFYERVLELRKKTLPPNHSDFAACYNNIGWVYKNMGETTKALSFYEKAFRIYENTVPSNQVDLGTSYNNIGSVYDNMGEHSKAFSYYEKSLEIFRKCLPANHLSLGICCDNVGRMYDNTEEYSKALSFYAKACEIYEKTLPSDHPALATIYGNIGGIYDNMKEYAKAVSFYEKTLEIYEKTLPPNHPDLATCHNNIGLVYDNMGDYSKALSFYEKALELRENTLSANDLSLATSYNNIGWVYRNMKEYSKALPYYERALNIQQHSLPPKHPKILDVQESIKFIKKNL